MAAGKRVAEAPPGNPPKHTDKKQKTATAPAASALAKTPKAPKAPKTQATQTAQQTLPIPIRPETSRNAAASPFTVVPATPGTIVDLAKKGKAKAGKAGKTAKTAKTENDPNEKPTQSKQPQPPPNTLPMEPHAAILAELQPKYAVRALSVISSTRMEKRIKAVLDHLASGSPASTLVGTPAKPLPGVVLLHARAPDANKLVSIAEIVKRRIREGVFAEMAAGTLASDAETLKKKSKPKKGKGKDMHAAAVAWYQYDRIYDVESTRQRTTAEGAAEADDGDDDEASEPAMHRLDAALSDKSSAGTKMTTYMSIMLSRTPILELHKNPEISVQCSTDPLEVEYEQFMAAA